MPGFRDNEPDCSCCFDCDNLSETPFYIWFDADANGTYELGPYPMTYLAPIDCYSFDFTRLFGLNVDLSCTSSPNPRPISVLYWRINDGPFKGQHGVIQGVGVCKPPPLATGGFLDTYPVTPPPWTRSDLQSAPSISPQYDPLGPAGNYWFIVASSTTPDPCSWIVTTGTGSVIIFGATGLYNFRITRGTDPF